MTEVWTLWHSANSDPQKDTELIGVYSSLDVIRGVVEKLNENDYFQKYPDGFTVDKNTLDAESYFTQSKTKKSNQIILPTPLRSVADD